MSSLDSFQKVSKRTTLVYNVHCTFTMYSEQYTSETLHSSTYNVHLIDLFRFIDFIVKWFEIITYEQYTLYTI